MKIVFMRLAPLKLRALSALLLICPAPSFGIFVAMDLHPGGLMGTAAWAAAKVWLFGLPVLWRLWVERQPISLSPPRRGGWGPATALGLVMALAILGGYYWIGRGAIEPRKVKQAVASLGLHGPTMYLVAAAYWTLINSVLEEYVFRWFIFEKFEQLLGGRGYAAVLASGGAFTIHHTLAMSYYFPWWINGLATLAILLAGCIWSSLYLRYRSVWIAYVCHLWADLAIFGLGYWILFA